jgi:hypothetical protein
MKEIFNKIIAMFCKGQTFLHPYEKRERRAIHMRRGRRVI